tara:strand:- start:57 stop:323 length:267 start_codon:yes stop_codon:yes gene_type:complete
MYENTYPSVYYFVVQRQTTPAEYNVVEFDNTPLNFTLRAARELLSLQIANNINVSDWKVLCSASSVDDGYDVIDRAIDVDEMLIGNSN